MEKNEHICITCNKYYKNYKSLWKHNYIYHNDMLTPNTTKTPPNHTKLPPKTTELKCEFCNKIYSRKDSLNRHLNLNRCKKINDKLIKLENENKFLKNKLKESNKTTNINNGNINNINNINNITINGLGSEQILNKLSDNEMINLLTGPMFKEIHIVELVKLIYTNKKFEESRNTLITNLKSNNCLTYNNGTKQFDAVNKKNLLENIYKCRKEDVVKMFEFINVNMKPSHKKIFEGYLNKLEDDKYIDEHKEEIEYIIFNCKTYMKKLKRKIDEIILNELSESDEDDSIEI